jgi:beta-xylosidase
VGSGYDHPTLPPHGYIDLADSSPLYTFGHRLTCTTFELQLVDVTVDGGITPARVDVRNTGDRPGTAVVQLYARDEAATIVRPVRQLVDWGRTLLTPGTAEALEFAVPISRLSYTWADGRRGVEGGEVNLLLGLSSGDIRDEATVEVPTVILTEPA